MRLCVRQSGNGEMGRGEGWEHSTEPRARTTGDSPPKNLKQKAVVRGWVRILLNTLS